MTHRVIRLPEVIKKTGLGRTTLYRMSTAGQFPESISLGGKAMGWIEAEIDKWIEERMRARQRTPVAATLSM
ncbi:AlpA family transcriptional regulator [Massilia sp. RP-1-19]|uniref:AlpA family transcriptional regulator n=1 Tax=Massilia polaris TaxID=2728846 RepID=A0A848HM14_9BURK|nr:AlpA family transcriptional regulator [Massilia polaris]NML62242.1 AlpA family transcriptional regulator [Massilia polaris]